MRLNSWQLRLFLMALFIIAAFSQVAVARSSGFQLGFISPIVHLLLAEPTHLERVLESFENPQSSHIFVAAHRGGREFDVADMAPGNSIANIDNAVESEFDLYESDIEILGDGTLVVFHDETFDALTNSEVANDQLDNADIDYAKSLFLTYTDGTVSDQRIPTLNEFLLALKGKIMVKFDLKPGTFGTSTLIEIMQTVESTGTAEQVLIRGGSNILNVADSNGFDTRMIMRRYGSAPSMEDIDLLLAGPPIRAISIPNGATNEAIAAANAGGLVVEIHESQNVSDAQRELDWQTAIDSDFRQFHSFKPSLLLNYLKENGYREF